MNVNEKGIKGLLKVMDDLQDKGYYTFPAFDDHSPVDLIALSKEGKTFKLQVKYRTKDPRKVSEKYDVYASSVVNGKRIPINRTIIDGWAVYLSDSKKVVYINVDLFEGKNSLTIDPEKNYGELDEWFKSAPC
jgi:hypothetical protein